MFQPVAIRLFADHASDLHVLPEVNFSLGVNLPNQLDRSVSPFAHVCFGARHCGVPHVLIETTATTDAPARGFWSSVREALRGTHQDYTIGSLIAPSFYSPFRWCWRWCSSLCLLLLMCSGLAAGRKCSRHGWHYGIYAGAGDAIAWVLPCRPRHGVAAHR